MEIQTSERRLKKFNSSFYCTKLCFVLLYT
nr:MAG TPA: hypothetical protein [Caudoviricetes sp.]